MKVAASFVYNDRGRDGFRGGKFVYTGAILGMRRARMFPNI